MLFRISQIIKCHLVPHSQVTSLVKWSLILTGVSLGTYSHSLDLGAAACVLRVSGGRAPF